MKIKLFQKRILGTAITVLFLMGVGSIMNSPAQEQSAPPSPDSSVESGALPADILPASPLAQVIRLMQAGVNEGVIMTFVTNSTSTFNLNLDKIIYLKDIGLPDEIVTAMMQRDQQLQQQMTATTYPPPAQPAPATTDQPETAPAPQPVEQPAEVTVNYFYDNLTPYGTWVDVDGYGRCWRPSVVVYNPNWQPYCDHGHWVYTDRGWYWFSDYSWGWAPFHYGRWFRNPRWGWCWAPDTVWGPSWVTWRYSDTYCGWAPLPPHAVYREGVGFFYNGVAVGVGFDFGLSWNCFAFVPIGHFCDPRPYRYRVAVTQVTQIYNHTTVINNFNVHDHNFVNHGIDPERITAVTRQPIHPVSIRDSGSPFERGQRGDQLSHDGSTLVVHRPLPPGSPAQNHSSPPNGNRPVTPPHQTGQPQIPNSTPHGPQDRNVLPPNSHQPVQPTQQMKPAQVPVVTTRDPQERNMISVPAQHPSPPAVTGPNYDNRTYSPRAQEHQPSGASRGNTHDSEAPVVIPPSNQGQSGASEASRHSAPVAAPAQPQPQHSQSSSSPRSSGQNQNQGGSGDNSGNGSKH